MKIQKIFLHNHRGITLLELLISLAILGLMVVAFAAIFLPIFKIDGDAAQLNHGSADITTKLENIVGGASSQSDVAITTGTSMQITFQTTSGGKKTITVPGKLAEGTDKGTDAKLRVFIPSN